MTSDEIKSGLRQLCDIRRRNDLPSENVEKFIADMEDETVCVPIVGAFSSGKTAAVNTLLGFARKILTEDITPETAIPTEIVYSPDETARVVYADGTVSVVPLDEYVENTRGSLKSENVSSVRLCLDHGFFRSVPRVMLVDMPGFGSGNDAHDRAINDYAEKSMAYIIAFPADDLILRDEIGGFLKELCTFRKPVRVMVTKTDKAPPQEDYEAAWNLLKKNLAKYLDGRDFEPIQTSSKTGNVEALKKYILSVQDDSERLLAEQKFIPFLSREAEFTRAYLVGLRQKNSMSESELKEREALLTEEIASFKKNTAAMAGKFRAETATCAQEIVNDARNALQAGIDGYVAMAMSGDEGGVSQAINSDVRTAVNEGMQKRFVPKAQKYVDGVSKEMEAAGAVLSSFHADGVRDGSDFAVAAGGAVAGAVVGVVGVAGAAAVGAGITGTVVLGTLAIPVVGIVVGVVAAIGAVLASVFGGENKRAEMKANIRRKLQSEVFPNVISQISASVQTAISQKTEEICADIAAQLEDREAVLNKALDDLRTRRAENDEENIRLNTQLTEDIELAANLAPTQPWLRG